MFIMIALTIEGMNALNAAAMEAWRYFDER